MTYYITKIMIATLIIVLISEIEKRITFMGAILVSVPLVPVVAMHWIYRYERYM